MSLDKVLGLINREVELIKKAVGFFRQHWYNPNKRSAYFAAFAASITMSVPPISNIAALIFIVLLLLYAFEIFHAEINKSLCCFG